MTYAPQALDATISRDFCLGVDLGTTFVAAAICDGPRPEMVTLGERSVVIPSAVYLDDNDRLLCGEAAFHRSIADPTRAARGFFKRRIGDPTPLRMGGRTRSVTELLAALLREVLRVVTEMEGHAPGQVMLTHPANWGPLRRQIFAEVAASADLGEVPTTTEPEAAAAHYAASHNLADGRLMAVYDLGGGTFDATVLRARRDGGVEIVGVPEGIERLGGIDFDNALFSHLDLLCDGALSSLNANDPQAAVTLARLEQDIVLAKEHMSVDARARVPLFLPDRTFDVVLTRSVFEGLIRAHVESTVVALKRTLHSAGVTADELDAILLVGGSSRIPLVSEMLTEALGRPVAVDTHPKYAVALGAATLAAEMHRVSAVGPEVHLAARRDQVRLSSEMSEMVALAGGERALALVGGGPSEFYGGAIDASGGPWGEQPTEPPSVISDPGLYEVISIEHAGALVHADGPVTDAQDAEHAPLMLVTADGLLAEPRRRGRRAPSKMIAAAVALLGTGAFGYWAHRASEPTPIMDVASPAQSCAGDCVSALAPPPAARPSVSGPECSTSAGACGSTRAPASSSDRAPSGYSTSGTPVRARGAAPVSPPVAPDEDVSARRAGAAETSAPGVTSTGKPATDKKPSKKASDKKSSGKHKGGSDSSPILGGIV